MDRVTRTTDSETVPGSSRSARECFLRSGVRKTQIADIATGAGMHDVPRLLRHAARKARWPRIGPVGLIGLCFVGMLAFDVVLEGVIFMPLGIWEYPGGKGPAIFSGTNHAFPLNEVVTVSMTFTALACLRYFRSDRGQFVVERGSEHMKTSDRR